MLLKLALKAIPWLPPVLTKRHKRWWNHRRTQHKRDTADTPITSLKSPVTTGSKTQRHPLDFETLSLCGLIVTVACWLSSDRFRKNNRLTG